VVALATIFSVLTGTWWLGERIGVVGPGAPPPELVVAALGRLLPDEPARADTETIRALREAVAALAAKSGPGVEETLQGLAGGDRSRAEALFADVGRRKAAEGAVANREAAAAFRHPGALACGGKTAMPSPPTAAPDPDDTWTWIGIARLEQQAGDLAAAAWWRRTPWVASATPAASCRRPRRPTATASRSPRRSRPRTRVSPSGSAT
jgi:hypothetical protein